MKFSAVLFSVGLASIAVATPLRRQSAPTDTDILNFALTLEHLENAFYSGALKKFSAKDFTNAGLPSWAYGRFQQISAHEASHVKFLSSALGNAATQPCTYKFPYTDPKSFVDISSQLEVVGSSAYTGASRFISNKDYLVAAASVLATEARHSGWVESSVQQGPGWSTAYETPLNLNQVYTIASAFITSCPESNPKLPVQAYPALATGAGAAPGASTSLTYTPASGFDTSKPLYAVFLNGQDAIVVPLSDPKKVTIPNSLLGYAYVYLSTDKNGTDETATVAGPTVLSFPFNSAGKQMKLAV